jgi:cytochrome c5
MVGGGFVENEDGTLYLALGDPARQWAKDGWKSFDNSLSQNPESPYGKVLRVSNWADFDSETVLEVNIFASGLRNPQGMTSTSNGDIFFTDHGARGGDELNILIEGKDYGWPLVSMGRAYTGVKFPNSYSVKTSPIYSWIPSIAPSDVVACPRILSDRYKGLTCTIVSSLRGMSLFVILTSGMQAQGQLRSVQKLEIGARIREVQASDSNSIEIFTDNGEHYKLTFSPIAAAAPTGPRSGEDVYAGSCAACHDTGAAGAPKVGDIAAWNPRLDKGLETLFSNALNGFNAMPAKGMCMSCSDDEIKDAVTHMVDNSK